MSSSARDAPEPGRVGPVVWEIPSTARADMRVPAWIAPIGVHEG